MRPLPIPARCLLPAAAFAAILGASLLAATPARADLRVCNQTANPVSIALGYRAERGWQSEGWWIAAPDSCAIVFQGDLGARFYYLFVADDIAGGAWDGQVFMCTRDESFTIFGVEDCLARGYERTGFFEVDTQGRTDWTLELTDPVIADGDLDGEAPGNDIEFVDMGDLEDPDDDPDAEEPDPEEPDDDGEDEEEDAE